MPGTGVPIAIVKELPPGGPTAPRATIAIIPRGAGISQEETAGNAKLMKLAPMLYEFLTEPDHVVDLVRAHEEFPAIPRENILLVTQTIAKIIEMLLGGNL